MGGSRFDLEDYYDAVLPRCCEAVGVYFVDRTTPGFVYDKRVFASAGLGRNYIRSLESTAKSMFISKSSWKAIILVLLPPLLAIALVVQSGYAVQVNFPVPSNTIWADDFEGPSLAKWYNLDSCGGPESWGRLNTTYAFMGAQSVGIQCANAASARDLRTTISTEQDYVGASVWFTYADVCRTTTGAGGPFLSLEFDASKDASTSYHYETHIAYYCDARVWQILDSSGNAKTVASDIECSYNCGLNTKAKQNWIFMKVVAQKSTKQWIQLITPTGVYGCKEIATITTDHTCGLNVYTQPGRIDQYNWQVELGWDTFALTGTCARNALFDNVLVTDETPASSGIVQPSASLDSGLILLIGAIGLAMSLVAGAIIIAVLQRKKAKSLPRLQLLGPVLTKVWRK